MARWWLDDARWWLVEQQQIFNMVADLQTDLLTYQGTLGTPTVSINTRRYLMMKGIKTDRHINSTIWDVRILTSASAVLRPSGLFLKIKILDPVSLFISDLFIPYNISDESMDEVVDDYSHYCTKYTETSLIFCHTFMQKHISQTIICRHLYLATNLFRLKETEMKSLLVLFLFQLSWDTSWTKNILKVVFILIKQQQDCLWIDHW